MVRHLGRGWGGELEGDVHLPGVLVPLGHEQHRRRPSDAAVFVKGGLPVEVFQESDNWRRIRDAAGNSGWVFNSLLSGRRTALVTPWASAAEPLPLYRERSPGAKLNARLETGVLLSIDECDGEWCRADLRDSSNKSFRGYVQQNKLWGVYPNEEFDD